MAGNSIKINTDLVAQVASNIESLNNQLNDQLNDAKATVDSLANVWSGEAAEATISAFAEFSAKYFQDYKDILDQYVKFLRNNVEQGYFDTETANTNLADSFK